MTERSKPLVMVVDERIVGAWCSCRLQLNETIRDLQGILGLTGENANDRSGSIG